MKYIANIGLIYIEQDINSSFVDNLIMLGVQLANVLTRCSRHPQGKSEARCRPLTSSGFTLFTPPRAGTMTTLTNSCMLAHCARVWLSTATVKNFGD